MNEIITIENKKYELIGENYELIKEDNRKWYCSVFKNNEEINVYTNWSNLNDLMKKINDNEIYDELKIELKVVNKESEKKK